MSTTEIKPGYIGCTGSFGPFVVTEKFENSMSGNKCIVNMLNTGNIMMVEEHDVINGTVVDPDFPVVGQIGVLGDMHILNKFVTEADNRLFDIWVRIINERYGRTVNGISILINWNRFSDFYADMKRVPNYEEIIKSDDLDYILTEFNKATFIKDPDYEEEYFDEYYNEYIDD